MSTPVKPTRPLPPFSPASPYSRPPPTSPHRRAPLLTILKTNVLALLFLAALRLSPFYFPYRLFFLRTVGLSRDWLNAGETVVITLLVWNAFSAGRKLKASGGLVAGATLSGSAVGRTGGLRGTPMTNKGSPKIRPSASSTSLSLSTSSPRLSSSASAASPLRASNIKPRFSLPADLSPPTTPSHSSTPSKTLKQSLNSSTHGASPLGRSVSLKSDSSGKDDASPVKVWKLRHSLGASGMSEGSPLR